MTIFLPSFKTQTPADVGVGRPDCIHARSLGRVPEGPTF